MSETSPEPNPQAVMRFWEWFSANDEVLFHFERNQEQVFDQLAEALNKVDSDLTFEFGPIKNGCREFVISAGGIKRGFPAVEALAEVAPVSPRWKVIRFRPRRPVGNIITFKGVQVDPSQVQYSLLTSKTAIGLYLYIPGMIEGDSRYGQIGYLLLDEALGEYDVEMKVGMIKLFPAESQNSGQRYSISELSGHLDEVYVRLHS